MRLIDADKLEDELGIEDRDIYFRHLLDEQPTAYNVDKVVEELKCNRCENCMLVNDCSGNFYPSFMSKLREIVRNGGCESA